MLVNNILVLGNIQRDGFAFHIIDSLKRSGYNLFSYALEPNTYEARDPFSKIFYKYYRYTFNQLLNFKLFRRIILFPLFSLIERKNIELIISTHDYLWPYEVEKIKKLKVIICIWFPDPIINFGKCYFFNSNYDALFFKDPFIVNKIRRLSNIPAYYLPECFNQHSYTIPDIKPFQNKDIVVYGSFYSWRNLLVSNFTGYDIKFFGSDPPSWLQSEFKSYHSGYPIFLKDKARILLESKIVLNNLNFGEIQSLGVRIFETAGIGAFQIFDYTDSVSDIFEEHECVTYKTSAEMKEKVDYYLNNPEERYKISEAARKKIIEKHTYENRLGILLNVLFNNGNGYCSKLIDE